MVVVVIVVVVLVGVEILVKSGGAGDSGVCVGW